jgi:hypothetical protein
MAYDDATAEINPADGEAMPGRKKPDDEALFRKLRGWYAKDIEQARKWREEAKRAYQFYHSEQWTDEEKQYLKEQQRPTSVFNLIATLVNAVVGAEIGNRREVRYIPREEGDSLANELLTNAGEWFRDLTDAEDEESAAYKDCVIAGMGWTETRLSTDDDPDGEPAISQIDPFEMMADCHASKSNYADAKRIWRARELSRDDAEAMFPGVALSDLHAAWVSNADGVTKYTDRPGGQDYVIGQDLDTDVAPKNCTVVECQWIEQETYYRVLDPTQGKIVEMSAEKYKALSTAVKSVGLQLKAAPAKRKRVMRAFLGAKVLEAGPSPFSPHFSYQAITGFWDRDKRYFYGIVRNAIDPQVWSNKLRSQTMHLINVGAKGGIMAEQGAFPDIREAQKTWARPDAITEVEASALSGGKIQPKPVAALPAAQFQMMQDAEQKIRTVTGINLELLGMREATQPGVLEYQRRQAGMSTLAELFNALRRYRKRQGRLLLFIIQNFLSDGRLIRIVGDDKKKYVPLTRDAAADVQYDIIVDDAPTSPNEKEKTFSIVMQMLPQIMAMKPPNEVVLKLLKYSPLPTSLMEELEKMAEEAKSQPDPEEQIKKQVMLQQAMAGIEKDKAAAAKSQAGAKLDEAKAASEQARMQADTLATALGYIFNGMAPPAPPQTPPAGPMPGEVAAR